MGKFLSHPLVQSLTRIFYRGLKDLLPSLRNETLWHASVALCSKSLNTSRSQKVEFLGAVKADKWAGTTKEGTVCIHEQSCYLPTLHAKDFPQCLYLQKHSSIVNVLVCTSTGCGACPGVRLLGTTHNWSFFSHSSGCRVKACKCRVVFAWGRPLGLFSMDPKVLAERLKDLW